MERKNMAGTAEVTNERVIERSGRLDLVLVWVEINAPRILACMIVLWIALIFVASVYKYETYGQGYDQVDFEQAIWNTTQGRIMADLRFNFTGSVFGMDWMPLLFFFVPFYAIIPSAHTLFFLQIVGTALGAIPVYWIARDKLASKTAGLGFGLAYLLYPVMLHGVLNPFQVRLFSVTLLLFAFYWYEKGNRTLVLGGGSRGGAGAQRRRIRHRNVRYLWPPHSQEVARRSRAARRRACILCAVDVCACACVRLPRCLRASHRTYHRPNAVLAVRH